MKNFSGFKGFMTFIREQGIVGLAVGFILGGSVSKLAHSLVDDIISPALSIVLGRVDNLESAVLHVGGVDLRWGLFFNNFIDFAIISAVVYFFVKGLKLDKLDKAKGAVVPLAGDSKPKKSAKKEL